MRTTLSLDPDVAAALQRLQKQRGVAWKEVVNETLRAGLSATERKPKKFARTRSVSLGRCLVGDVANTQEVLSLIEGDWRR